jgi:hypothetical protein
MYRTIWLLLDSVHRLVCGSFIKDHSVSETGCVSVLRWMGQGRPTQLGPSERANLMFEIIYEIISHRIPSVNILYQIRDVFLPARRVGIEIILWTPLREILGSSLVQDAGSPDWNLLISLISSRKFRNSARTASFCILFNHPPFYAK